MRSILGAAMKAISGEASFSYLISRRRITTKLIHRKIRVKTPDSRG
jgi:hypothetical protein